MIDRILGKDIIVKIAAVVLAVIMWGRAVNINNPPRAVVESLPVVVEVPSGKVLTSVSPSSIHVTFEGRSRALLQLKPGDLSISIQVPPSGSNQATVPVDFKSPYAGVEVIDINPKEVVVGFDDWVVKEVGLKLETVGRPNEEFVAERPVADVDTVQVSGARRKVDQIQVVGGDIDVTGAVSDVYESVALAAWNPEGDEVSGIEIDPPELKVTVPMTARPPAKVVPVLVGTTGVVKEGYRVGATAVSPNSVEIRGDVSITRNIYSLEAQPVDVTGREATFNYTAYLDLPSGVTATNAAVTVTVEILEDLVERVFNSVVVQLENLPAGYHFGGGVAPPVVDVVVTGRSDIVGRINASEVQAFIDAGLIIEPKEMKIEKRLPVYLRGLPDGVTTDIRPAFVTLTLTRRGS